MCPLARSAPCPAGRHPAQASAVPLLAGGAAQRASPLNALRPRPAAPAGAPPLPAALLADRGAAGPAGPVAALPARLVVGGGYVDVSHKDGVAQGKVVVERLGQVKAQAFKQVRLERHCKVWMEG